MGGLRLSGRALPLAVAMVLASPGVEAASCTPKATTARVLASANPNDIHPDWAGGSNLGLSWSLETRRRVSGATGTFLQGDLISPRGGVVNRGVFVLASEWDCT